MLDPICFNFDVALLMRKRRQLHRTTFEHRWEAFGIPSYESVSTRL